MKLQIRTSQMTDEQIAKEKRYEDAIRTLRNAGFQADFIATVVSSSSDEPGFISLRER